MENIIINLSKTLHELADKILEDKSIGFMVNKYPRHLKKNLMKILFSTYKAGLLKEDTPENFNTIYQINQEIELFLNNVDECEAHFIMIETLTRINLEAKKFILSNK